MKFKLLKIFFIVLVVFLQASKPVSANTAGSSAQLISISKPADKRAEILHNFLEKYDSPLAPYAYTFVEEADKNKIDWKLVAAISGNESQFGHLIPPYSYNGWGYGVYGNNIRRFSSWAEGISVVSKAIRTDYIDKWGATNVYEIGSIYAEDPMWASKISHYISMIENFEEENPNTSISISL